MTTAVPPPAGDSPFWESPALKQRSKHWPAHFVGVPMRIRMLVNVRPDGLAYMLPGIAPGTILRAGEEYGCWTNTHGAVAGICANGKLLGVKPDEFEVVAWYQENTTASERGPISIEQPAAERRCR